MSNLISVFIGTLKPDPDTPSIINGGVMLLTGPCFSKKIEKITCLFTDKEGDVTNVTRMVMERVINGITVNEQAVCPLPLFRRLGIHTVTVNLSNGTQYSGDFTVGTVSIYIHTAVFRYFQYIATV